MKVVVGQDPMRSLGDPQLNVKMGKWLQTYYDELQKVKVVLPFANTTEGNFKQSFSGTWKSDQKPTNFE